MNFLSYELRFIHDRMNQLLVYCLITCGVISVACPTWMWLITVNNPLEYFSENVPISQTFYIFPKLFALYAFSLCWLQITISLFPVETSVVSTIKSKFHAKIATIFLLTALAHITLFVTAVSLRNQHFASGFLSIRFNSGYYDSMVSIGLIGAMLFILVAIAGFLTKFKHRLFIFAHRLSFLAFALIFAHGIAIGTESRLPATWILYWSAGVSVLILMLIRMFLHIRRSFTITKQKTNRGN